MKRGRRAGGFAVAHARRNCWCSVAQLDPAGDLDGDGRGELGIAWMDPFQGSRSRIDAVFGRRSSAAVLVTGTKATANAGVSVPDVDWPVPFAAFGDLDGDHRDDLLLAPESKDPDENHHSGLQLLSGKAARGPVAVPERTPARVAVGDGVVGLAREAGDVDGDGRSDLLVGWASRDLSAQRFAVVYGAAPMAPVDLSKPGPGATLLP